MKVKYEVTFIGLNLEEHQISKLFAIGNLFSVENIEVAANVFYTIEGGSIENDKTVITFLTNGDKQYFDELSDKVSDYLDNEFDMLSRGILMHFKIRQEADTEQHKIELSSESA